MQQAFKKTLLGASAIIFGWAIHTPGALAQSNTVSGIEVSTAPLRGFVAHGSMTVSKTDTPLIELPRSVSIVTADEIANRGVQSIGQIFAYSAGVNSDNYGGGPLSRVYSNVRGFFGFQYLDGLKLHDSNWGMEAFGLERAELLKGPPSALFGQSNPGGILNLVSKRPSEAALREVQIQVGSFDRIQGAVDFGGRLDADGRLLYRIVALARDGDTVLGRGTQDSRLYIAPSLTWRATDKTDITLLASHQWDPKLANFQFLPRVGAVDASPFGFISRKTFDGDPAYDNTTKAQSQIAYLVEHRVAPWLTARQNARYTYIDIHQQYLQGGALAANQRTQSRTAVLADYIINLGQIDTNLNAKFATGAVTHNVLAGVDYAYIPSYQGQGTAVGPTLDLYAPVYNLAVTRPALTTKRQQHQRQTGFYVQDQVKLGDLSVLVGLRHDHATTTTRNRSPITGAVTSFVRQHDDAWTGQAGAIYRLPGGFAPFVNYSKSFFPTAGTDFFGTPFVPSTGKEVEAGLKFQPANLNLLATGSVFDLKQNNVRTPDLVHPNFTVQTGQIRSRGFEAEVKTSIAKLNLTGSYTRLSNKVTRSNTTNLGKFTPGRPRDQAAVWADYAILPAVTVGAGVRVMGPSWGDALNTFRSAGYTLTDALVRVDLATLQPSLARWDAAFNATNLFDKRYVSNCDAATQCFYGPNRLVKVTLRRRW